LTFVVLRILIKSTFITGDCTVSRAEGSAVPTPKFPFDERTVSIFVVVAMVNMALLLELVDVPNSKLLKRVEVAVTFRYPLASRFVEDTEASDDCPEMLSDAP